MDMSFLFPKAVVYGAIVMSTIADAGRHSLPIKRTTTGLYWKDPAVFQQTHESRIQAVLGPLLSPPTLRAGAGTFPSVSKTANAKVLRGMTIADDDGDDGDVDAWFFSLYTTDVAVGNPPLMMTACVDTSWSTFFVPSANCSYDPYELEACKIHPMYNSSLSSTYQSHLDPASLLYVGLHMEGNVSQDSIHVAGIEIKEQLLEEATLWHPDVGTADHLFDNALGLSLHPSRSSNGANDFMAASPFQNMMQQKLLDRNMFSLKLGRVDQDAGELTFGGLSKELKGLDMIEVPLNHSRKSSKYLWDYYTMGGWQISVTDMSFSANGSNTAIPVLKKPQIAAISSSFPWIGLPRDVVAMMHVVIGIQYTFHWIECDKRKELPNWTIVFGPHGQSITLTPWDYLIDVYDWVFKQRKCVSAFFSLDENGDEGFIILGQPFLNGLYSVFDADRKSISFANLPM